MIQVAYLRWSKEYDTIVQVIYLRCRKEYDTLV